MVESIHPGTKSGVHFVYDESDRELVAQLQRRANQEDFQVPQLDSRTSEQHGIDRAFFIVVVHSEALHRSRLAEVATARGRKPRPRVIEILRKDTPQELLLGGRQVRAGATAKKTGDELIRVLKEAGKGRPVADSVGTKGRYAFISHTGPDGDRAAAIVESLQDVGMGAWSYSTSPRFPTFRAFGDPDWRTEVLGNVARANAVVVVLNRRWQRSGICQEEYQCALETSRPLVFLDYSRDLAGEFDAQSVIRASRCDFDTVMIELLDHLKPLMKKPMPART